MGYDSMELETEFTTWDQYFKQCGIYQGRCWWHDLSDLIVKLKRHVIKR